MHYEVWFGGNYHIVEAGNPWHACILVLQEADKVYYSFEVCKIGESESEVIGLDTILEILRISVDETDLCDTIKGERNEVAEVK